MTGQASAWSLLVSLPPMVGGDYEEGLMSDLVDFYRVHDPVYSDHAQPPWYVSKPVVGPGQSLTRQEFADECNINVLMSKYEQFGTWPLPPPGQEPQYLDVSNVPNLMEALEYNMKASAAFMTLPAKVRREFDNDPVKFVDFASDPNNLDQMREWQLAPPKVVPVATPGSKDAPLFVSSVPAASSAPVPPASPAVSAAP